MESFQYLNVNSTAAKITGKFNPSDLGYQMNRILRSERGRFYDEIRKFVNASSSSKVISTSGSTEAIATCVHWAKVHNNFGSIVGSELDHSSVKDNCDNYDMKYSQVKTNNVSAFFITLVGSQTGEINDMKYDLSSQERAKNEYKSKNVSNTYKPLVIVDATQAITRMPINMQKMKANALFFSLHKIGGPIGCGILIIDDSGVTPFKPLIAGSQNGGLRGGTQDDSSIVQSRDLLKMKSSPETRRMKWEESVKYLQDNDINVIVPKRNHLYNTILIDTSKSSLCSQKIVDELSKQGIYVGTASACDNEKKDMKQFIRISFDQSSDINDRTLSKIVKVIFSS